MSTNKSYKHICVQLYFHILFVIHAEALNQISVKDCTIQSYQRGDFKNQWANDHGTGLTRLLKGEFTGVFESLPDARQGDICFCLAKKLYSFRGDETHIFYTPAIDYCKTPSWLSWLGMVTCAGVIKCTFLQRSFYILESDKFYWSKKTKDIYLVEISDEEEKQATMVVGSMLITRFNYPTGIFKAIIPQVDFKPLYRRNDGGP